MKVAEMNSITRTAIVLVSFLFGVLSADFARADGDCDEEDKKFTIYLLQHFYESPGTPVDVRSCARYSFPFGTTYMHGVFGAGRPFVFCSFETGIAVLETGDFVDLIRCKASVPHKCMEKSFEERTVFDSVKLDDGTYSCFE